MPLFVLPGQFSRHADLYQQLGQLLAAGVPVTTTLKQLERRPPSRSDAKPLGATRVGIEQGMTFGEAARSAGAWLPPLDLALIDAGEKSGRLEACLAALGDYYDDRAKIARELAMALMYPVFLLHAAPTILAFPAAFQSGDWLGLVRQVGWFLLPFYVAAIVVMFLTQSRHGEWWRAIVERIVGVVPLIGKARRELALARLCMALEALLTAGVTIVEAWQLAAASSGSPALRRTVETWLPDLEKGQTPAELVQDSPRFPTVFASQYATGEISGQLEDTLRRLQKYFQDAGSRKLHLVAQVFPWIVYLGVAGFIAYKVLQFWMGYFEQIGNVLQ